MVNRLIGVKNLLDIRFKSCYAEYERALSKTQNKPANEAFLYELALHPISA
jgi:hypothetical protein